MKRLLAILLAAAALPMAGAWAQEPPLEVQCRDESGASVHYIIDFANKTVVNAERRSVHGATITDNHIAWLDKSPRRIDRRNGALEAFDGERWKPDRGASCRRARNPQF